MTDGFVTAPAPMPTTWPPSHVEPECRSAVEHIARAGLAISSAKADCARQSSPASTPLSFMTDPVPLTPTQNARSLAAPSSFAAARHRCVGADRCLLPMVGDLAWGRRAAVVFTVSLLRRRHDNAIPKRVARAAAPPRLAWAGDSRGTAAGAVRSSSSAQHPSPRGPQTPRKAKATGRRALEAHAPAVSPDLVARLLRSDVGRPGGNADDHGAPASSGRRSEAAVPAHVLDGALVVAVAARASPALRGGGRGFVARSDRQRQRPRWRRRGTAVVSCA